MASVSGIYIAQKIFLISMADLIMNRGRIAKGSMYHVLERNTLME
jgi:hypothetical protein